MRSTRHIFSPRRSASGHKTSVGSWKNHPIGSGPVHHPLQVSDGLMRNSCLGARNSLARILPANDANHRECERSGCFIGLSATGEQQSFLRCRPGSTCDRFFSDSRPFARFAGSPTTARAWAKPILKSRLSSPRMLRLSSVEVIYLARLRLKTPVRGNADFSLFFEEMREFD